MKGDPALRNIPIVILTTSRAEQDVLNAYEHHANWLHHLSTTISKWREGAMFAGTTPHASL